MTLGQQHALNTLLTKVGETVKLMDSMAGETVDPDHCSPGVYLTIREWRILLEQFGCQ